MNCWEFFNCGREPGGLLADALGVCPVAANMAYDGVNGGRAAGRCCWEVSPATGRGGRTGNCAHCSFRHRVLFEQQHPETSTTPTITV